MRFANFTDDDVPTPTPHDPSLHTIGHDALDGLRATASANGWAEVAYDAREEQQRRVARRQ